MKKKWIGLTILNLFLPLTSALADTPPPKIYNEGLQAISVTRAQPQFIIQLASNPTTGYSWELQPYNPNTVVLVDHRFLAPKTGMMGAPGMEQWTFIVKNSAFKDKHDTQIQFQYGRAWESAKVKTVSFQLKFS